MATTAELAMRSANKGNRAKVNVTGIADNEASHASFRDDSMQQFSDKHNLFKQ